MPPKHQEELMISGQASDFYIHPASKNGSGVKVDFMLTTDIGQIFDVRWSTEEARAFANNFTGKLPEQVLVSALLVPFPASSDPNEFLALTVNMI